MAAHSNSYEVAVRLARHRSSVPRARALSQAVLGDWGVDQEVQETAELVLSELITNALKVRTPRDRHIGLRIVRPAPDGWLRLEVSDGGGGVPAMRVPGEEETGGRGLVLVDALAQRWGYDAHADGRGKTVWAEVKAPGVVPEREVRRVAAVTVRAGQSVWLAGAWRVVQAVRVDRYPLGGLAVVVGLDEGRPLRLRADEPLTVRDAGAPPSPRGEGGASGTERG